MSRGKKNLKLKFQNLKLVILFSNFIQLPGKATAVSKSRA